MNLQSRVNNPAIPEADKSWLLKIIRNFLPDVHVLAFGSRVHGHHKRYSDLDIALKGDRPIEQRFLGYIQEHCDQSNIPYKIDIMDYQHLSLEFKEIIDRNAIELV